MGTTLSVSTTLSMKCSTFYDRNDPFNGECTQSCLPYWVPAAGNPSCAPAAVRVLVYSARSNNVPAVFLQLGTSGHVSISLQLDKTQTHAGMPCSAYVGQMLVQHRELIVQNQAVVVHLPDSSFNTAAVIQVPFTATISTALVGKPDIALMGP